MSITHTLPNAGIFADPRTEAPPPGTPRTRSRTTDVGGRARGFAQDRRLALEMAKHAEERGASVPANALNSGSPNAVYPRDLDPVPVDEDQLRNTEDVPVEGESGEGASGGGWFATAVRDPDHPEFNRPAMTIITVEVQANERIEDVAAGEQKARELEIEAHASALREIFLGPPRPATPG